MSIEKYEPTILKENAICTICKEKAVWDCQALNGMSVLRCIKHMSTKGLTGNKRKIKIVESY